MKVLTRRELLSGFGKLSAAGLSALPPGWNAEPEQVHAARELDTPPPPPVLPGTEALTQQGEMTAQMVQGMHQYLLEQTAASVEKRQALWHRDLSSPEAYEQSIAPNRERFRKIVGLIDERTADPIPSIESMVRGPSAVALGSGYKVYSVR